MKATDEQVTEALRACGGNASAAARRLGMARSAVQMRVARSWGIWPRELPPPSPRRSIDGASVTTALREAAGNITAAARALGIPQPTLQLRVTRHPELWPEGVERLPPGPPRRKT